MATTLELKSYMDLNTLVNSLSLAIGSGMLSREQAQGALKDQLYESGLLKRLPASVKPEKVELKKKE